LYYLHLFYKKYASDDKSELSFLVSCLRKAASNESWIEITDMLLDGNKSLLSDMENIGNIISLWIRSDDKIKKNEFIIMNLSDIFFNSRKEFFAQNRDLPLKWQGLARDVKGELLSIRMQIQGNEDLRETIDDFISDLDSCLEGK
jgi:hypothetical protein